jgi:hypothetical protein
MAHHTDCMGGNALDVTARREEELRLRRGAQRALELGDRARADICVVPGTHVAEGVSDTVGTAQSATVTVR